MIKGTIYKLSSSNHEKIYIGSTQTELRKRLYAHKHKINHCSSKDIIDAGNPKIEPIEHVECETKQELNKLEGLYIQQYGDACINKRIAGRTNKEYYQDNLQRLQSYARSKYVAKKDGGETYAQLDRYYNNKKDILREIAMRNSIRLRRPPTKMTMEKHGISFQDLATYAIKNS